MIFCRILIFRHILLGFFLLCQHHMPSALTIFPHFAPLLTWKLYCSTGCLAPKLE